MDYVAGRESGSPGPEDVALPPGGDPACFLCRAAAAAPSRENLVVRKDERTLAILNRYPYNNGHLLIAPLRHVAALDGVSRDEHFAIHDMLVRLIDVQRALLHCDGFNIGLNLGRAAGAGVPGHLHWHLVPRWSGDHNFMATTAHSRVISQSLEAAWELLTDKLTEAT